MSKPAETEGDVLWTVRGGASSKILRWRWIACRSNSFVVLKMNYIWYIIILKVDSYKKDWVDFLTPSVKMMEQQKCVVQTALNSAIVYLNQWHFLGCSHHVGSLKLPLFDEPLYCSGAAGKSVNIWVNENRSVLK